MSALSSQAAPTTLKEGVINLALLASYPEETRYVVDYRANTARPANRPNLLVRRRKRAARRLVR
ncbi:MAG: hypothetical protein AAFR74_00260 [Pseudomonadota bacterium]